MCEWKNSLTLHTLTLYGTISKLQKVTLKNRIKIITIRLALSLINYYLFIFPNKIKLEITSLLEHCRLFLFEKFQQDSRKIKH